MNECNKTKFVATADVIPPLQMKNNSAIHKKATVTAYLDKIVTWLECMLR